MDRVVEAIATYAAKHNGRSPSYHEIMADTGIPSTHSLHRYIAVLVEQGRVRKLGSVRGLQVIETHGGQRV